MSAESAVPAVAEDARQSEYLQLYRDMEEAAARDAAGAHDKDDDEDDDDNEDAASSSSSDDSDNDSDVDESNSRFVWPGLTYPPSLAQQFRLRTWVPLLRSHTIPTRFIPLTSEFVAYLQEDGVWIPEAYAPVRATDFVGREDDDEDEEERAKWAPAQVEEIDTSDEEAEAAETALKARNALRASQPFFPEVVSALESALASLGGAVFPSLDFRAPNDATWIMTERLPRCQSVGDVLLMIKSSDKAQRELDKPLEHCSAEETTAAAAAAAVPATATDAAASSVATPAPAAPFGATLALRKWSTLHPSKLFRVFVWRHSVLAMSQLDANYYEFLQSADLRDEIQDAVEAWLEDDAAPVMAKLGVENYVMDLYLDTAERVWLVKTKPFWPRRTRAVLFSWKELHEFAQAHDQAEAEKTKLRDATRAALAAGEAAPAAAWPSSDSLSVPFRVIPSAAAGMDILRAMDAMSSRFPSEGFDVSDSAAIDRWIQRVESGDLKQN